MENKIKQLLVGLKYKFEYFFEKRYKIRATAMILSLFRLLYNNILLDLTKTQFCKNNWLENRENLYLQNF